MRASYFSIMWKCIIYLDALPQHALQLRYTASRTVLSQLYTYIVEYKAIIGIRYYIPMRHFNLQNK